MSSFSSKLDSVLINKAVNALYKYEDKKTNDSNKKTLTLLSGYSKSIIIQVQLMSEIKRPVIKPIRIKIPNTMFTEEEDHSICFFCKSDDKKEILEYIEKHPVPGLSKVIAMNEVKKYYHEIKDKKLLLKSYTHFICDASIAPQLYNVLGSTFSARNNHPVQIRFQKKFSTLNDSIQKVINSTYFHLGGKNISIKFGILSMTSGEVAENIVVGLPHFISKLQNEWKDVHSIHIKTTDSASLPIYSKISNDMTQYVAEQAQQQPSSSIATTTEATSKSNSVIKLSTSSTTTVERQKIIKKNKDSSSTKDNNLPLKSKSSSTKRNHDAIDIIPEVVVVPVSSKTTTNNAINNTTATISKKKVSNIKSTTTIAATASSNSSSTSDKIITNKKVKDTNIDKKKEVEVTLPMQRKSSRNLKN